MAALLSLRESVGSPSFVLLVGGLISFFAGAMLVPRYAVEPLYDVFSSWKSQSPPMNWRVARDRYFRLNVIRGLGSGTTSVLFLVSLSLL